MNATSRLSAHRLICDPAYYLHSLDLNRGELRFVEVTPDTYKLSSFLDHRIGFTKNYTYSFSIGDILKAFEREKPELRPVDYIFHIAFCCSTLLARSLQIDAKTLVLREPLPLRQLADLKRRYAAAGRLWSRREKGLLDMIVALLGKRYTATQSVLIKPTNLATNLLPDLVSSNEKSRALILYADIRDFLISNLKKQPDTQKKIPALARAMSADKSYRALYPELSFENLDLTRAAALMWHVQLVFLDRCLHQPYRERLRSLRDRELLDQPRDTLAAACRFLGYPISNEGVDAIVNGPVWHTHAKDPRMRYDTASRRRENAALKQHYADEIAAGMEWAEQLLAKQPIPAHLPAPLLR